MALVPMRLLLDHAAENGYGLPAYKSKRSCALLTKPTAP
jgi:fructose/tagatose bisphosphate aldolase